jgi:uncharacterized protein YkwD
MNTSMRPRRFAPFFALALVAIGVALAAPSTAQSSRPTALAEPTDAVTYRYDAGLEAQFVARINQLRASKGLSQLQVHGQLTGVARNWTAKMVQAGQISHNPNLASQVQGNWRKLGENVGVGYDVDGLMKAFINSPAHYRNLVDPDWNFVGVGAITSSDGRLYTTHNFMLMPTGAPPPSNPPPSNPPPTTRPPSNSGTAPPATTATTAAPTTTTTVPVPKPHPSEDRVTAVLDPLRSLEQP